MSAAAQAEFAPIEATRRQVAETVAACVAELCSREFGRRLRALVLTGSFARDEASICAGPTGYRVLGDAEFLVVFRRSARLPGAGRMSEFAHAASEALAAKGVACAVHLAAVHPAYLQRLPPHIFSYELRAQGRVVWGERGILGLAPEYYPAEIEKEDAWRLLSNRLIEWLEAREACRAEGNAAAMELRYRTAKLWMDAGTSLLVFLGRYAPGYRARAERLTALALHPPAIALPFPLARIASAVERVTAWKLDPRFAERHAAPAADEDAAWFAARLWCWEAARLANLDAELAPRALVRAFARKSGWRRRARGWLHLARENGGWGSRGHWRHWRRLAASGTPRDWLYAIAAEWALTDARRAGDRGEDLVCALRARWLRALLPIPQDGTPAETESAALAGEIARQYHQFVETTRA